jgi:hypothetical protein
MAGSMLDYLKSLTDEIASSKDPKRKKVLEDKLKIFGENENKIRTARKKSPEAIVDEIYFGNVDKAALRAIEDEITLALEPVRIKYSTDEVSIDRYKRAIGFRQRDIMGVDLTRKKKKKTTTQNQPDPTSTP